MISAAKCYVHATYTHPDAQGLMNCYVRRVYVGDPSANRDCNGSVNLFDMQEFTEAYAAGSGRADYNADGAVTAADSVAFSADYQDQQEP